jgi:hypothetical protein
MYQAAARAIVGHREYSGIPGVSSRGIRFAVPSRVVSSDTRRTRHLAPAYRHKRIWAGGPESARRMRRVVPGR